MTEPVVLQRKDPTGRTVLDVYGDLDDAERGYLLASAGPGHAVHVEPECPHDTADMVKRISANELVRDPFQDMTWKCTHSRDGDGYLTPIGVTSGQVLSEDERNLRDMIRADQARNFGIGDPR